MLRGSRALYAALGGIIISLTGISTAYADILVATGSKIDRYSSDGTYVGTLVSKATTGMYFEPKSEKLYFTGIDNSIHRVDRNGSNDITLWNNLAAPPLDLVVDTLNNKIIWTSPNDSTIYRANLDGTGTVETFVSFVSEAWDLDIDEINRVIYYTSFGRIYRVALDGKDLTQIVTDGEGNSFLTFLIKVGNRLYWSNPSEGAIKAYDLKEGTVSSIMTDANRTELQGLSFTPLKNRIYFLEDSRARSRNLPTPAHRNSVLDAVKVGSDWRIKRSSVESLSIEKAA